MFYTVGDVEHPFWVNSMVLYGRYTVEPGETSPSGSRDGPEKPSLDPEGQNDPISGEGGGPETGTEKDAIKGWKEVEVVRFSEAPTTVVSEKV